MNQPDIDNINLHFIIAKERTGSSLLVALLNEHPNILSTSEEPFLLYFYNYYKSKDFRNPELLKEFLDDFWVMQEENLSLFYSTKQDAFENLYEITSNIEPNLDYLSFCKAVYMQFLPFKDKSKIKAIVDKQLKYTFHLSEIQKISPDSKYIFLVREPKGNIYSCYNRNLGIKNISFQAALWNIYTTPLIENKISSDKKLFIYYEDLISNPQKTIDKIVSFLGLPVYTLRYNYQNKFLALLESKRNDITEKYYSNTKDFMSGLLRPIDKEQINKWKKHLSAEEINKIDYITYKNAKRLKFSPLHSKPKFILYVKDYLMILYAYLYKVVLLKFYRLIPLKLKVFIKKVRKNKNECW